MSDSFVTPCTVARQASLSMGFPRQECRTGLPLPLPGDLPDLVIVRFLEMAFAVCVFVDCCRHKMKKKWLWLLFIALGYLIFSVISTPEQFKIGVNAGVFLSYTSLIRYSTGGFVFRFMIPIGAIVYLICRKSLFAKYEQFRQQKKLETRMEEKAEQKTAAEES